jgi:hypothetical protein
MRSTYRVLAHLVALGVVLQAASIAFAWFAVINELEGGAVYDQSSEGNAGHMLHGMVGMNLIPLLSLALLVVSFFAKVPGGVRWAAIVLGLAVLQVVMGIVAFGLPAVGALHGVNALVLFSVALVAGRRVGAAGGARATEAPAGATV